MRLAHLALHNFRNYVRLDLDLSPGVTVLVGDNAQGKTNLLEAIYYLATTRSPHSSTDREVVNWLAANQEPLPYARLVGRVARAGSELTIEITLTQQNNNGKRYQKQIRVNGVARRAMDLLGQLNVVLFSPEDITLVSGPPSRRRQYLDATLCQIDPAYCRSLSRYNQVVVQRNALLRDLAARGGDSAQLTFWDERLVEYGSAVLLRRQQAVAALDGLVRAVHRELTGGLERLQLHYLPGLESPPFGAAEALTGPEALAATSAAFQAQLHALRSRELGAGVTLAGPHRDELRFLTDKVDAGIYGSRGQQRTVTLALKLAEVELMRRETGEQPVLLLDDVLSELDAHRRQDLLHTLENGPQQAVLTTTDLQVLPAAFVDRCQVWRIELGRLSALSGV
jgi:DNA replication and repair protein RecF